MPGLVAGDTVTMAKRIFDGQTERDGAVTTVLYDGTGRILLATVSGVAKSDRVAFDLLKDLQINVEPAVICSLEGSSTAEAKQMHRVDLSVGTQHCALDHHTVRCCDLWDASYQVRVQDAFSSKYSSPVVNVEVARGGFWIPHPGG